MQLGLCSCCSSLVYFVPAAGGLVHAAQAYKALTDEVSKENYKKYGHPDGPQAMSGAQAAKAGCMGLHMEWNGRMGL